MESWLSEARKYLQKQSWQIRTLLRSATSINYSLLLQFGVMDLKKLLVQMAYCLAALQYQAITRPKVELSLWGAYELINLQKVVIHLNAFPVSMFLNLENIF